MRVAVDFLESRGVQRYGLIAGSLGVLGVLPSLTNSTAAACALISPVYRSDIATLSPWESLLTPPAPETTPHELAREISTPMIVVHGLRDEVVASEASSAFVAGLPEETPCEYLTLPDEGHVFHGVESWVTALSQVGRFMRAALEGA